MQIFTKIGRGPSFCRAGERIEREFLKKTKRRRERRKESKLKLKYLGLNIFFMCSLVMT
jgi:hypothetical protein